MRTALLLLSFASIALPCGFVSAQEAIAPKRLPRENLLVYRDKSNHLQPVESIDDWRQRRSEIVTGMQTVMGALPGNEKRCPLDVQLHEEVDCGKYMRRLISYASEPGSRVPAYLCIPKAALEDGAPAVPAALCLHGTDNTIGHGTVVGLGRPNRNYAGELAERGWVTLAPNYPLLAKYQPNVKDLGWESGTLKAVWDNVRGLDLLDTLPYVQQGQYGAIGHSLGGHNSIYTAVFDPRITTVVTSCGLDSYLDYYQGKPEVWQPGRGWTQVRYMPRLADYREDLTQIPFDFHEMIGALAPRPVLIIAPLRDSNFRHASVDRIAAAAKPIYQLYDRPTELKVLHPDIEHDFPPEMRQQAYEFLEANYQNPAPPKEGGAN